MKRALAAAGVFLVAVAVVSLAPRPPARAQFGAQPEDFLQFRIFTGLTDTEPKEWKGRLTISGGGMTVSLRGDRFSGEDRVWDDGRFAYTTKIGPLENQEANPGGQTDWNDPRIRRLIPQAIIVKARGTNSTRFKFTSPAGEFEFAASAVPYHKPWFGLNGNVRVDRMPPEERISEEGTADDYPAVAVSPGGQIHSAWLSYADRGDYVVASDGRQHYRLTEKGDHHGPAIAIDNKGWVHVVWAQREDAEFHLYTAVMVGYRWSRAARLTTNGSSNLAPAISSDGGRIALAWQSLRKGHSAVMVRFWDGRNWSSEQQASGDGNAWSPSIAYEGGKPWVAWDSYASGAYQIYARPYAGLVAGPVERITTGGFFSVRPSVAISPSGTPVVAWEESGENWGKDFAFLIDRRGTTLYKNRRVRAAFRDGDGWKEIAHPVEESLPMSIRRFVQQPRVTFDAAGRLHLGFRCRTSTATARMDNWASGGRWESFVTRLDGERWQSAIPLPSSVGRNGMRVAIAASGEFLHAVWPTDNRIWPGNKYGDLDIQSARIPLGGAQSQLSGAARAVAPSAAPAIHPNESADTARIRDYRIQSSGKTYRILRGDLHRHTELSHDGVGDGSLEDLYRYTLDAAAMDYAHVADHQMGTDEEYNWWITQKSNDLYFLPERFVPLYGYERSVPYPNGHRNVIWAERGKPVLKISPGEQKGAINTGSVLYPYLQRTDGIATSHTSATPQGTDWRDNDPALEPIVEIYQGFESSYETAGAPRAWKEGDKAVHNGLRPAGYVWSAWAKGLKLGVQSSSDHVSTHTSYACVIVEEFTRKGLVDAMRKRHTYAATDSIVLDYRVETSTGEAIQGDIVESSTPPKLRVKILGTAPVKQVDIVRNNAYVYKLVGSDRELTVEYADQDPPAGESYYYVRVEQADGQLAWSSPVWVKYSGKK